MRKIKIGTIVLFLICYAVLNAQVNKSVKQTVEKKENEVAINYFSKIHSDIINAKLQVNKLPWAAAQVNSVCIILPSNAGMLTKHSSQVLARQIKSRCNAIIVSDRTAELRIELSTDKGIAAESFRIDDGADGTIRIIGGDERGLIYGIGKFLHTSRFDQSSFMPSSWRGTSTPEGKVRGMYFATHFNNFYEAAPIGEVQEYLDDLALWGINYLLVTFPRWQFTGFNDSAAQHLFVYLRKIMSAAKLNGMKVGIGVSSNDGFKSTPKEFLRVPVPDPLKRRGNFGVNLDPSNPRAHEMLMRDWAQLMDQFKDVRLDNIVFAPYDEGGCGCQKCWPWGARGFPKLCHDLAKISRGKFPGIEIVLSTWVFDTPPVGEWEGLAKFLNKGKPWVDYILAGSHEDFPRYPLDHGVPGGLPLLNFPEISMWGQDPWGGYGANPLPGRLQRLWNETDHKISGGFPYSEGLYEDINKVICSQLYWNGHHSTDSIIREYIAFEFSTEVVDEVAKVIGILESNHDRKHIGESAIEAFSLIKQAELKLTAQVLKSWRWRILFLRTLIDREMFLTKGELKGETLKKAFAELTILYHAENSHSMPIHPPVIK